MCRFGINACRTAAFAVMLVLALCTGLVALPLPEPAASGMSGIEVRPAIIHKELGRFLWIPDTRIGDVSVVNRGTEPVAVSADISGITHDGDGSVNLLPAPSEVHAALVVSPAGPITVPPGASATFRLELDRSYSSMPDQSGVCAALVVTSTPLRGPIGPRGVQVGSSVVLPVLVKFSWCGRLSLTIAKASALRHEDGRLALGFEIANEGGPYASVGMRVSITADDGSRVSEAVIDPALTLPGCCRQFAAEFAGSEFPPGRYFAEATVVAGGKAVYGARYGLEIADTITVSSLGPL